MKFLNHNLFTGDITVNGTTTLSTATGITRATGDNTTHLATTAFVKAQDYATNTALGNYVPLSRTLTINGITFDLSANRSWTIATSEYTSTVKHIVKAGAAITKGQAVYVTSSDGTNMIVGLASNTSEATSSKTMGLVDTTVSANGFTSVITEGLLAGLDTSTAAAGDPVWLGANGNLIFGLLNKPTSPLHLVYIGVVTRVQSNNGEIFVKVQNGIEIDEIHDVQILSPATGQLLRRDTDGYWKNWTPNFLVPSNVSGTTNYVSKFTGANTVGNSQIFDNGTNVGIGTTSPSTNLHVAGSVRVTGDRIDVNSNTRITGAYYENSNTEYTYIDMYNGGNASINIGTKHPLSYISFESGSGAYTERMRITNTGNVGIGTTNPAAKLQVIGTTDVVNIVGAGTTTNKTLLSVDGSFGRLFEVSDDLTDSLFSVNTIAGLPVIEAFADYTVKLGPFTNQVIINNLGNVGLGIASPTEKLHVNGRVRIATVDNGVGDFLTLSATGVITDRTAAQVLTDIGAQPLLTNPVTGTGTSTRVAFWSNPSSLSSNANLYWDNTNSRLGIGTTTPADTLTVVGTFRSTSLWTTSSGVTQWGASGTAYGILTWDTGYARINANTGNRLDLGGNGGLHMSISTTGNVGIGTTSPAQKLHVVGNTTITGVTYTDIVQTYSGASIDFRHQDASVVMRVDTANARVGIGTTSPAFKLDINGASNSSPFRVLSTNTTSLRTFFEATSGNVEQHFLYTGNQDWVLGLDKADSNKFKLASADDGFASAKLTVTTSGNVGIGTTAPTRPLYVVSTQWDNTSGGGAIFENNNSVGAGITLKPTASVVTNGSNGWAVYAGGPGAAISDGNLGFWAHGTNEARMVIQRGGNIGIGTNSPTNKLQVANGNMSITTGYSFILADTDTNWRLGRNIIVESGNNLTASTFQLVAANGVNEGWQFVNDDGFTVLEIGAETSARNVWINAGNLSVGVASPQEKIHVAGNVRIDGGSTVAILQTNNATAADAGTTYRTFTTADHYAVFVDYVVYDAGRTNMRTGTFRAVWTTGNVVYTDVSTVDLGGTDNVTLTAAISGANVNLIVTGPTDYTLKYSLKVIK